MVTEGAGEGTLKASVVDLRYRMNEVLSALERNETVEILYHGKIKGIIQPSGFKTTKRVKEHKLFCMRIETEESVNVIMEKVRGQRYK